ncbi:MAG: ATP-NAD kinase family protein [Thermoplasmatota archaeon]
MRKLGLVVNPIAGMGGRVGLKGTDGVADEALRLGAAPVAPARAVGALRALREARDLYGVRLELRWLAAGGQMGESELLEAGWGPLDYEVVYRPPERTTADDTRAACRAMWRLGADLIVFCGGDGTARDVLSAVGTGLPILGIPAGVKMHSGVFGVNPVIVSEIIQEYLSGRLEETEAEILDLDEELYRRGEWRVRVFGLARTPHEPSYIQSGKVMVEFETEDEVKGAIADYMVEKLGLRAGELWILGPGSTVQAVASRLGVDKTLLGVDAVLNGELIARDANEATLLSLLSKHPRAVLVLSPIGAQGFILGRGNLQLSPDVVRRVGLENIEVVATPAKLARTPVLRVDTGDPGLDRLLERRSLFVVTGYRQVALREVRAERTGGAEGGGAGERSDSPGSPGAPQ